MILRNLFPIFILLAVACKENSDKPQVTENSVEEPTETVDAFTIEDIYNFAKSKTLDAHFSEDAILETKNWIEEDSLEVVTLKIYPDTPKELLINYTNINKTSVYSIEVYAYDSPWKSKTGIYMGMPVDELEKLNEKPLTFLGYEWDYAGAVDFENGVLSSDTLFVYLGTDGDVEMPADFIGSEVKITAKQAKSHKIEFKVTGLMYRPN